MNDPVNNTTFVNYQIQLYTCDTILIKQRHMTWQYCSTHKLFIDIIKYTTETSRSLQLGKSSNWVSHPIMLPKVEAVFAPVSWSMGTGVIILMAWLNHFLN